jgi:hypothetical protein
MYVKIEILRRCNAAAMETDTYWNAISKTPSPWQRMKNAEIKPSEFKKCLLFTFSSDAGDGGDDDDDYPPEKLTLPLTTVQMWMQRVHC